MNVRDTIEACRAEGRAALVGYLPVGYPDVPGSIAAMTAMVKAGVELAFESMVEVGIKAESAYYESLHETPLIANLISRKKLYEMNKVISDTAEYGCYLFSHAAVPLLKDFVALICKE